MDGAKLIKFELDTAGVRALLLSNEVASMLSAEASARCPDGCVVDVKAGQNRINARIVTDTPEAYQDNLDNNTLLQAIS